MPIIATLYCCRDDLRLYLLYATFFLKYYSVSPNRLILLNDYFVGHWYPNKNNTGKATAKTSLQWER